MRFAVGQRDLVDHRGGGGDEVEIELAAEALLDDFEMQQAEEAAAEAEAERGARFPSRSEKLASLSRSLPMASRSSSKSEASTGNRPQNTTGCAGRKPGSACGGGLCDHR